MTLLDKVTLGIKVMLVLVGVSVVYGPMMIEETFWGLKFTDGIKAPIVCLRRITAARIGYIISRAVHPNINSAI